MTFRIPPKLVFSRCVSLWRSGLHRSKALIPFVTWARGPLNRREMTLPAILRFFVLAAAAFLCACAGEVSVARHEGTKPGLATKPVRTVSTSASKHMYVRTTAYHH